MNPLAKLSQATFALAEAKTFTEVKAIRDLAEQARLYAQANKLGLDAMNEAIEIRLRADRKLGEVLLLAKETGEIKHGRPEKSFHEGSFLLEDVGISHKQSHITQQLAKLPEAVFEERLQAPKRQGKRITTSKVLVKEEERQARYEQVIQPAPLTGKYRVLYADPPWKYGNTMPDYFSEQADHYPLLTPLFCAQKHVQLHLVSFSFAPERSFHHE